MVPLGLPAGVRSRPNPRRARRLVLAAILGLGAVLLSGCGTEELHNLAMPARDNTATSHYVFDLWRWGWVAALATGVVVWGLILYACFAFRRRSDDEIPVQTRYNLPLEIFYTIAPVIMVVVFFFHTVNAQNSILEEVPDPDHVIDVVGQQWQWTSTTPTRKRSRRRTSTRSGPRRTCRRWCCRSTRPSSSGCTRPTSSTTSGSPAS